MPGLRAAALALIAERDELLSRVERMRQIIRQFQRAQFGRRSERLDPDQLQLALEERGNPRRGSYGEVFRRRLGALIDHAVGKYHDTDVGFLCPLPLPVLLDEDKGPDQQDGYSIAMPTLFFLRHQNRRSAHFVTHAGDDHRRRQAVAACHIIQEPTTEVAVAHIRPQ